MRTLSRLLPPRKRLEWYPPFRAMRIRVVFHSDDLRHVRIRLPLNRFNRNPGGGMFGGAMASLADPIPALLCSWSFPGYAVWTRALSLDFRREGRTDLELRFSLGEKQADAIRAELAERHRASPVFEYGFYDDLGHVCAWVHNRVAIRPRGYRPGDGALGGARRGD